MTVSIKNIYCIGRNYALHAEELNNPVPTSPFLFSKPTHAVVEANGQIISLPGDQGEVHYELEFVVHIARPYEQGIKIEDLVDKKALGIDFTLRDVQNQLKEKKYPWLVAKGFPNSAVLTAWSPFEGLEESMRCDFSLEQNGREVQRGNIKNMIFNLPAILEFCAKHFGLDAGDIVFTGTPAGVGPVADGDHLVLKWNNQQLGECMIKLAHKEK